MTEYAWLYFHFPVSLCVFDVFLLMIKYSSLPSSRSLSVTSPFSCLSPFVCQVSVWQINDDWWLNTFDSVSLTVCLPFFPLSLYFFSHRGSCCLLQIHISWLSAFSSIFTSFSQHRLCHHFRRDEPTASSLWLIYAFLPLSLFFEMIFICFKVPFVCVIYFFFLVLRQCVAEFSDNLKK